MEVELHDYTVSSRNATCMPNVPERILKRLTERFWKHYSCQVSFDTSCDLEGQKSSVFDVLLRDRIR